MSTELVWYCPLDRFVVALCQGWRVPAYGGWLSHHGHYSVLLVRAAARPGFLTKRRALHQRDAGPMVARATERVPPMDVEVVKFEGWRVRFELTSRKLGLTTVRAVYQGKVVGSMTLPGDPTPLAENLRARARARTPLDLVTLAGKMAA